MRGGGVRRRGGALCAVAALLLAACTGSGGGGGHSSPSGPNTLTILGGSELSDLQPLVPRIERDTGLQLRFEYAGSLDGAEQIVKGSNADLAWFSNGNYIS